MATTHRDQALEILRQSGPTVPMTIASRMNSNTMIAGAILSELAASGLVLITRLKVGGSPLYYIPGQEAALCNFCDKLGSVDKHAYDLLLERKVLKASELQPVERVALTNIPDFAKPFQHDGALYFRWFLLNDDEALRALNPLAPTLSAAPTREPMRKIMQPPVQETTEAVIQERVASASQDAKPEQQPTTQAIPKAPATPVSARTPDCRYEQDTPEVLASTSQSATHAVKESQEQLPLPMTNKEATTPAAKSKPARPKPSKRQHAISGTAAAAADTPTIPDIIPGSFEAQVTAHFASKGVGVAELRSVRKGKELDLIVRVPSAVGTMTYYCKAKNKAKGNDGDLGMAYATGQKRNMPVLFVCQKGLTKRAETMLKEFGIAVDYLAAE